jgi:hypothetical protein
VEGKRETILMRWFTNLNDGIDHLAFECQTNHIWAEARDSNTKVKCYVTKDIFEAIVVGVKFQCLEIVSKLVVELDTCFPIHELHEALDIVYLHYWLLDDYDESFNTHLNVLKVFFCTPPKKRVAEHVVLEVLCAYSTLDVQKSMFKIIMKSNAKVALGPPNTINPLTKMCRIIFHFIVLSRNISKYVKLTQITMIQVLGSMEDEQVFNNLNFIKTKICNQLIDNLALCVHMFGQSFFIMHNFLYMKLWGFGN